MIRASLRTNDGGQKSLAERLKEIVRMQVYVGIPEERTGRKSEEVNNAQLLYIHTNGSPLHRIPARPVIEPAIEASDNGQKIAGELGGALKAVLDAKPESAKAHMKRAGMTGQNAAREWFTDPRNDWSPNAPATAARKANKLRGKARKEAIERLRAGEGAEEISRPLIDTGQMRKAIIYVVKDKV